MNDSSNKTKYLLPVVIILLIIFVALWYRQAGKQAALAPAGTKPTATTTTPGSNIPMVPVATIPAAQIPKGMPANLPWEKGAKILSNFQVSGATTTQSTRVYVSSKTMDQNWTLYSQYLKNNGWTVTSSLDQAKTKNLVATKGSARMSIIIAEDSTGQIAVNVSYVD